MNLLRFGVTLCSVGSCNIVTLGDHTLVDSCLVVAGEIQLLGLEGKKLDAILLQGGTDV